MSRRQYTAYLLFCLCILVSGQAMAAVIIHDPLMGSTLGTKIGSGTFIGSATPGWKSTGGKIVYDAGHQITDGYFQVKMRGWTAPAQGTDKSHPLAGWESKNKYSHHVEPGAFFNWRIGSSYIAFKVLATPQGLGLRQEARVGSDAKVNAGQPGTWHTYRVEWKNGIVKFFFNGELLQTFSFSRYQNRYFTIGTDDQYGITSPPPIISDLYIVDRSIIIPTNTPVPPDTPTPIHTPTPTAPPGFSLNLCSGLNLVSNMFHNSTTSKSAGLLNSICPGNAEAMWWYDCNTKSFRSWTVLDTGDGWSVWPNMPFWVNIANPAGCVWVPGGILIKGTKYIFCEGFNMVAIPLYTLSIFKASDLLAAIPGCTAVYRWGKEAGCVHFAGFNGYFVISAPWEDFTILPGRTYFINLIGSATWTPPDP